MIKIKHIQDSIAQQQPEVHLQPLYEPEAVPFTFDTVGWKIVGVMLVLLVLIMSYKAIKTYKKNANRRKALAVLQQSPSIETIFILLKQLAIEAYGRQEVSALYGISWLQFLDKTGKNVQFSTLQDAVQNSLYKNEVPNKATQEQLKNNAINWIKTYAR